MRRQRCMDPNCRCVEHFQPPQTVRMIAVGFPPKEEPLAGFVYLKILADGTAEIYWESYANGTYTRQPELPTEIPASWWPAFNSVRQMRAKVADPQAPAIEAAVRS